MSSYTITIHLKPRSSRNEVVSQDGDVWTVRLTAPPVDNKANKALLDLLARELKIPKSLLSIIKGHTSKTKVVEIQTP